MSSYITDVGNIINGSGGVPELKNSTSRKKDTSQLDMTDFLTLMVVQLQNQSIDNTMDTSDMINQMVQMQMITALTNMTDASVMSYASSLVGKEVTIGVWNGGQLEEKVVTITGSGVSNGTQVLFAGDEVYNLSSVMAVGRLPQKKVEDTEETEGGTGSTEKPTDPVEGPGESGETPADKPMEGGEESGETPADKPVESTEESGETRPDPEGEDGPDTGVPSVEMEV